jgi:tetratricopeptide (TPR) repeat protein
MSKQYLSKANRSAEILAGLVLLAVLGVWLTPLFEAPAGANSDAAASARLAGSNPPAGAPQGTQEIATRLDAQAARGDTQSAEETQPEPKAVSAPIAAALTDIIELLNADKIAEARAELEPLLTGDMLAQLTPYERSRLYQLSFNLNMKDESYDAAQADLYAAIESGGLSAHEASQAAYQIGQLFVQKEDYAKAADSLEFWVARSDATQNPGAYYLLAASYYYQDKYADAQDHMETLMSMPGPKQEAWYSMLAALYLKSGDYAKAKPVMETMVQLYGRERYREQLAGIDAQLGKAQQ